MVMCLCMMEEEYCSDLLLDFHTNSGKRAQITLVEICNDALQVICEPLIS